MRRFASLATSALLLATLAGCGDVASPEYGGETLGVLRGTLVSELATPLPEVDIVIGWWNWNNGDETSTPFETFARLSVDAALPARFSASIFDPPPATAYRELPPGALGPRFATAGILLARKGREVRSSLHLPLELALADENMAVLTSFDDYHLAYFEADGKLAMQNEDGTITEVPGGDVTKGFQLARLTSVTCAESVDEACIAAQMADFGSPPGAAWQACTILRQENTTTLVPLDTEITLTLRSSVSQPRPPLCTTPPPT
jgi:hypothetical protein